MFIQEGRIRSVLTFEHAEHTVALVQLLVCTSIYGVEIARSERIVIAAAELLPCETLSCVNVTLSYHV